MRDLRDDVSRCPKAVDAEISGVACHHQRAPADQASAQERCKLGIFARLAKRKAVADIGDEVAREAAVARIAGELRLITEIFLGPPAERTGAAGEAQPGYADAHSSRQI